MLAHCRREVHFFLFDSLLLFLSFDYSNSGINTLGHFSSLLSQFQLYIILGFHLFFFYAHCLSVELNSVTEFNKHILSWACFDRLVSGGATDWYVARESLSFTLSLYFKQYLRTPSTIYFYIFCHQNCNNFRPERRSLQSNWKALT